MKHLYLEDSIIWKPKRNITYHIKHAALPNNEVIITFKGNPECLSYFDCSSGLYAKKTSKPGYFSTYAMKKVSFLSKEAIPLSLICPDMPPILLYRVDSNDIIAVTNLSLTCDDEPSMFEYQGIIFKKNIEADNTILHSESQKLVEDIPVVIKNSPLFIEKNRPNYKFLGNLYQKFITYNTDEKLKTQYNDSSGQCHIRAHFVNLFLALHGIESYKIYKLWHADDWKAFKENKAWRFHAAGLLIDKKNRKWVFDPWVGLNKYLIPFKNWINRQDEPKPRVTLIGSKSGVNPAVNHLPDAAHFMSLRSENVSALQAVMGQAIPNSPLPAISLNIGHSNKFFLPKERKIKKNIASLPIQFKPSSS